MAITFNPSAEDLTEYLAALGRRDGLKDGQNNPRVATEAEGKEWLKRQAQALVLYDRERQQPDIDRAYRFGA